MHVKLAPSAWTARLSKIRCMADLSLPPINTFSAKDATFLKSLLTLSIMSSIFLLRRLVCGVGSGGCEVGGDVMVMQADSPKSLRKKSYRLFELEFVEAPHNCPECIVTSFKNICLATSTSYVVNLHRFRMGSF